MKKFLRIYLPLIIVISAVCIFTLRYLIVNHETALKSVLGAGKVISPAKKAVLKVDEFEPTQAKIFEADGRFYLLIESVKNVDLLVIDKAKNDVALSNGNCAEVIFSNYLFLADCGYGGVFYSSAKADNFNTQLKISDSNINFVVPNHKIEIIFKGE